MSRHVFQSDCYLWVVSVGTEDNLHASLKIERNLTGKRKGRRPACTLDMWNIDCDSPHGQWIRALMTVGDGADFPAWVQSFHSSRPDKTVTVDFGEYQLICKPGKWNGPVKVRPCGSNQIEVTSCPP